MINNILFFIFYVNIILSRYSLYRFMYMFLVYSFRNVNIRIYRLLLLFSLGG